MTDEIIINGVDVSGCRYFKKDEIQGELIINCQNAATLTFNCSHASNCYYKQLKRKEEECESLKEKYSKYEELEKWCKKIKINPKTKGYWKNRAFCLESELGRKNAEIKTLKVKFKEKTINYYEVIRVLNLQLKNIAKLGKKLYK